MIHLIDNDREHANKLRTIILDVAGEDCQINMMFIPVPVKIYELVGLIDYMTTIVEPGDVVLLPWQLQYSLHLNDTITGLTKCCEVVAAAGNSGGVIDNMSPASADSVLVAASLNKKLLPTKHSATSNDKPLHWIVGTNYVSPIHGPLNISGTSVSAAVLAAIVHNRPENLIDTINEYNQIAASL